MSGTRTRRTDFCGDTCYRERGHAGHHDPQVRMYTVPVAGESYPCTLDGLQAAIVIAAEWATSEPVDILKVIGREVAVIRTVPVQPPKDKPRKGYHDARQDEGSPGSH